MDPNKRNAPRHEPGEIVWADFGNYLESPGCSRKARPMILLKTTDCQHYAAGITTKAVHATSGTTRPPMPTPCGPGGVQQFLWSSKAARVCRIDVREHIGWVDRATVLFLRETMPDAIDAETFAALWRAACRNG